MKRIYFTLGLLIALTLSFTSCEQKLDENSIFDINPPERTRFDYWILEHFTKPFNVELFYRFEDIESSIRFNLLPAELGLAKKMAQIVKHAWIDAYVEVVDTAFLRRTMPRTLQFIGSSAFNSDGSRVLGTAEGGQKVTLYEVNDLTLNITHLNSIYFWVMHHEFAHILHQQIMYDVTFREITPAAYIGNDWLGVAQLRNPLNPNAARDEALRRGVITPYSLFAPDEDFVEMFTAYILTDAETWEEWMQIADTREIRGGFTGRDAIEAKLRIQKQYMRTNWGLDMDLMREVSLRRAQEVLTMEFDMFGEMYDIELSSRKVDVDTYIYFMCSGRLRLDE